MQTRTKALPRIISLVLSVVLLANLKGIPGIIVSQPITENGTALVLFIVYLIVIRQESRKDAGLKEGGESA